MKAFNTKIFTFEIGLFGPQLMYYKNNDAFDGIVKSVLVISFILFRLQFEFSLNVSKTIFDMYGFKFEKTPLHLIFYWGDLCKVIRMPWEHIVVERILMDVNNVPCYNSINYCDIAEIAYNNPEKYLRNTGGYGYNCKYYVIQTKTRPSCLANTFITCFDKISYEIVTNIKYSNDHQEVFTFITMHNIAMDAQISLQITMHNNNITSF